MCIAIVKPQGTEITDECLKTCFENNNDGAGIAYAKNGKIHIIKGIFDKKDFVNAVRQAEKVAEGDMLIHCRIGTSGLKDKKNCHPHIVNDNLVMIHNGILDIDVPAKSKVSDTVIFIDNFLKDLEPDFVKNKPIMKLIEQAIGERNKFAFLNNKGESFICNAQAGIYDGGIWFSNSTYLTERYYDFFGGTPIEDAEIYGYFEEYIDMLDYEDLEKLGDYPLIDLESWMLEAYDMDKYEDDYSYIALEQYSPILYQLYYDRYIEYLNIKDLEEDEELTA